MERWKKIRNTTYEVSNLGRVRTKEGNIKKLFEDNKGYMRLQLYVNGKRINKRVHRLVAEAFIPNPDNKPTVNHKDGNKKNNSVENLEWATYSENQYHSIKTELNPRVTPAKIAAAKYATYCRCNKIGVK